MILKDETNGKLSINLHGDQLATVTNMPDTAAWLLKSRMDFEFMVQAHKEKK